MAEAKKGMVHSSITMYDPAKPIVWLLAATMSSEDEQRGETRQIESDRKCQLTASWEGRPRPQVPGRMQGNIEWRMRGLDSRGAEAMTTARRFIVNVAVFSKAKGGNSKVVNDIRGDVGGSCRPLIRNSQSSRGERKKKGKTSEQQEPRPREAGVSRNKGLDLSGPRCI
ncbi:uncharacterized protein BT62DRAFT_1012643 [Guyanagaster necrorhizus]|uniref:Uncharacterized protein n=1 Tax=Guyanagaster necrorhizus TaxID=856835 RepID=A0A9P8AM22_9AGAR|nr:uncharacterized protein BT62DRAFT_1012643 [Guyanagaster necrorhizus MCA 3950]KAG7440420.1 hypothetical protein BT62DRAFT_1012643 [Guyanagaster necrorhizus MCA 3950]